MSINTFVPSSFLDLFFTGSRTLPYFTMVYIFRCVFIPKVINLCFDIRDVRSVRLSAEIVSCQMLSQNMKFCDLVMKLILFQSHWHYVSPKSSYLVYYSLLVKGIVHPKMIISPIYDSPLCWWRLWRHFLIRVSQVERIPPNGNYSSSGFQ